MYKTIEADIDNGVVTCPEAERLPPHAHVLITLLPSEAGSICDKQQQAIRKRRPHPEIRGKTRIVGDILESVPTGDWNLPS